MSILEGPTSPSGKSNRPSGSTKEPKGHTGSCPNVSYTTGNRKGSSQANEAIGLNSHVSDTKLEKE